MPGGFQAAPRIESEVAPISRFDPDMAIWRPQFADRGAALLPLVERSLPSAIRERPIVVAAALEAAVPTARPQLTRAMATLKKDIAFENLGGEVGFRANRAAVTRVSEAVSEPAGRPQKVAAASSRDVAFAQLDRISRRSLKRLGESSSVAVDLNAAENAIVKAPGRQSRPRIRG